MKKKITALFLCFVMVLTMLPVTVFAEPGETSEDVPVATESDRTAVDEELQEPEEVLQEPQEEETIPVEKGDETPCLAWEWAGYDGGSDSFSPDENSTDATGFDLDLSDEVAGRFVLVNGESREPVSFERLSQKDKDGGDAEFLFVRNEKDGYVQLWAVTCGEFKLSYTDGEKTYDFPVKISPRAVEFYRYMDGKPMLEPQNAQVVWPYSDYAPSHNICLVLNATRMGITDPNGVTFALPEVGVNSDMTLGSKQVVTYNGDTMVVCPITMNELKDDAIEITTSFESTGDGRVTENFGLDVDDQRDGLYCEWYSREGDDNHPTYRYAGGEDRYPWARFHNDGYAKIYYRSGENRICLSQNDVTFNGLQGTMCDPENNIFQLHVPAVGVSSITLTGSGKEKVGLGNGSYGPVYIYTVLPGFGLYSKGEATGENYLDDEWYNGDDAHYMTYDADNDTVYLIVPDSYTLVNKFADGSDGIWSENGNKISYKLSAGGHMATIKLLTVVDDQLQLRFAGTWDDGNQDDIGVNCRIQNNRPALMFYWARSDWDDQLQQEVYVLQDRDNDSPTRGLSNAPGDECCVKFVLFDGKKEQAVDASKLTAVGNVTVEPLQEGGFARIRVTGFGLGNQATIRYALDGVTYTFPVEICLPDIGFYSGPEATEENYLPSWQYTGSNNTVYLISRFADLTAVRNDCATDVEIGSIQKNRVVPVTVKNPATEWIKLRIDGRWDEWDSFQNRDRGIRIDDQRNGLMWCFDEGDMTRYIEIGSNDSWHGKLVYRNGEQYTPVQFSDLRLSGDGFAEINEAGDGYVELKTHGAGVAQITSATWGGAPVSVSSQMNDFGLYSAPERKSENYLGVWKWTGSADEIYLIVPEYYTLSQNDAVISQNGNRITVEVNKDGHGAVIRMTECRDRWLNLEIHGRWDGDDQDSNEYAGVEIENCEPSLYWVYADSYWDDDAQTEIYYLNDWSDPEIGSYTYKGRDFCGQFFFGVPGSQNWHAVDSAKLQSDHPDVIRIQPIDQEDDNFVRLETVGWGNANISDGQGHTFQVTSQLPDVGVYSTSVASQANFTTSWGYAGKDSKLFVVAREDDFKITDIWADNYGDELHVDIRNDGKFAVVTLDTIKDRYFLDLHIRYENQEDWDREEWFGVEIKEQRTGLFLRDFGVDDDDNIEVWEDQPLCSDWTYYPDEVAYQFVYRAKADDDWTVVGAEDLQVNDAKLVTVNNIEFNNGKAVDMDFAKQFAKDIVFTYKKDTKAKVTVRMELPDVGVYSAPEATEANFLKQWVYNGENPSVYVIVRNPNERIESLYFRYLPISVNVDQEYNGMGNVAQLTVRDLEGNTACSLGIHVHVEGEYQEDYWEYGYEFRLRVREGRTGLYLYWARIGAKGEFYVDDEAQPMNEWDSCPGDSYRYILQPRRTNTDGTMAVVPFDELELSRKDGKPCNAEMEAMENGMIGFTFRDFGEYILKDQRSGATLPISMHLPDVGLYTAATASEANYITQLQFSDGGDANNTYYIVASKDSGITKLENFSYDREVCTITMQSDTVAKLVLRSPHLAGFNVEYDFTGDGNRRDHGGLFIGVKEFHSRVYMADTGVSKADGDTVFLFAGDKIHLGAVTTGLDNAGQYKVGWDKPGDAKITDGQGNVLETVAFAGTLSDGELMDPDDPNSPFGPVVSLPVNMKPGEYAMRWYYVDKSNQQVKPFTLILNVMRPDGYTALKDSFVHFQDGDTIYVKPGETIQLAPMTNLDLINDFVVPSWYPDDDSYTYEAATDTITKQDGFTITGSPVAFEDGDDDHIGPKVTAPRKVGEKVTIVWGFVRGSTSPASGKEGTSWATAERLQEFRVTVKVADNTDNEAFKAYPNPDKNYPMSDTDVFYFVPFDSETTLSAKVEFGNVNEVSYRWYRAFFHPDGKTVEMIGSGTTMTNPATVDYKIKVTEAGEYHFEATDGKGNYREVIYFVGPESTIMDAELQFEGGRLADSAKPVSQENPLLVPVGGEARFRVDFSKVTGEDGENAEIYWMSMDREVRTEDDGAEMVAETVAARQNYTCFVKDHYGNMKIIDFAVIPDTQSGKMYVEGTDKSYGNGDTITVRQGQKLHLGIVSAGLADLDEDDFYLTCCDYDALDKTDFMYDNSGDGCFFDLSYDDQRVDQAHLADEYTPSGPVLTVPKDMEAGTYQVKWFYCKGSDAIRNGQFHIDENTPKIGAFSVNIKVEPTTAYTVMQGDTKTYADGDTIQVKAGTQSILVAPVCDLPSPEEEDLIISWFTDEFSDFDGEKDQLVTYNGFALSGSSVDVTYGEKKLVGTKIDLPTRAGEKVTVHWKMCIPSTTPVMDPSRSWEDAEALYDFTFTVEIVPDPSFNADFAVAADTEGMTVKPNEDDLYLVSQGSGIDLKVKLVKNASKTITYQWYSITFNVETLQKEYNPIYSSNSNTYHVDDVQHSQGYRCVVFDGYGHDKNIDFEVGVENHFTAKAARDKIYAHPGDTVLLELLITADHPENMNFTWYCGENLFEATAMYEHNNRSFVVPAVTGTYGCQIQDCFGNLQFVEGIKVIAVDPVTFTEQPQDVTTYVGGQATFTVAAQGEGLTYQWQYMPVNGDRGWLDISGATKATLSFTAAESDDGKEYRCVVYDANKVPNESQTALLWISDIVAEGEYGQNGDWVWQLKSDGTLSVFYSGTGENPVLPAERPWASFNGKDLSSMVKTITILEGVYGVCDNGFTGYANLTTVKLPSTVKTIGAGAFSNSKITDLYFEGYQEDWNAVSKAGAAIASGVAVHLWQDLAAVVVLPDSIKVSGEQKVDVTVKLLDSNGQEVKPKTTSVATDTANTEKENVSINGVAEGSYTMEVAQKGCVTRTVNVEVSGDNIVVNDNKDVTLVKVGNLNGATGVEGETDAADMQCLFTYLTENKMEGALKEDEVYFKAVADVNGDENVNILDYQSIYDLVKAPAGNMAETALVDVADGWGAYDTLVAQIKQETDPARRVALMHQAEDMVMATYCAIPLYYYPAQTGNSQGFHYEGTYLMIFNSKDPLFADKNYHQAALIREAVSTLIDRNAIVAYVNGADGDAHVTPANTFVPVGLSDGCGGDFHASTADGYFAITDFTNADAKAAALMRARTLLEAAGYTFDANGKLTTPIQLTYSYNNEDDVHAGIANRIKSDLAVLGISVTVDATEWSTFCSKGESGSFQTARYGWVCDVDDPLEILNIMTTASADNWCQMGR